jgi:hypothetical protein
MAGLSMAAGVTNAVVCLAAYAIHVPSSHSTVIAMASDPDVIMVLVAPNGIGEGKGSALDWICRVRKQQSSRAEGIASQRKRKEDSNKERSRQVKGLHCGC